MSIEVPRGEAWLLGACSLLAVMFGLLAGIEPRLAIGASLAIAFTLIALADLTVGLALFTFLGFVVVVPNFAGQTLSVMKIAALPLLVSWLALVTRERSYQKTFATAHPFVSLTMLLFLTWVVLSYLWAESGGDVVQSVFRYVLAMILVFIVFTAVQKERDVTLIVGAMVVGAVCAAVYGFLNPVQAEFGQLERLGGTLGNPNELAAALVLGIALSGGLAVTAKSTPGRLTMVGAGGICFVAILMTGSRGGLIALGAMLISTILLSRGRRLVLTFVTLAVLLAGIGYFLMAAPEQSRERILHPGSGSGRTDIWTVGMRMVEANPVKGVGAGNFPTSSIHYLLEPGALPNSEYIASTPKVAESMYLEVVAELGFTGGILFFSIVLFGLGCAIASISRLRDAGEHRLQALATAIAVALIGLLAADFFASEQYARELWLLVGLGPALLAIAKRAEREAAA